MINLYNHNNLRGKLVESILKAKSLPFDKLELLPNGFEDENDVVIEDKKEYIVSSYSILEYLEERYPSPRLYPTQPENKARVRMLLNNIFNDLYDEGMHKDKTCNELKEIVQNRNARFIFDDNLSVIDLAITQYAKSQNRCSDYTDEIDEYLNQ